VFDESGALQAMLECKGTSIGGTARDKPCASSSCATRQYNLGGIPLLAVLGGMGGLA
jgi:hypothetical protein